MHRFSKHLLRTTRSASYQHQRLYATTLNGALQPETKLAPVPTVKENTGETGPNEQDAMLVDAGEQRMSDCNHGLADFFRAKQVRILDTETDSRGEIYKVTKEVVRLVTLEPVSSDSDPSGRAWKVEELRRKSFQDLHTLWYILLRERNLLATQMAEARRFGIRTMTRLAAPARTRMVKKSMRGIKFVLNERRIAYVGALEILAKKRVEFEQSTTIPELSPAQPGSTIAERPKKSAKAKQPS